MAVDNAVTILARELVLREGAIPSFLSDRLHWPDDWNIAPDGFVLRISAGLTFAYRPGAGVVFERSSDISDETVSLYFSGSVYGAVAWINGFIPLHASAVCHAGKVYAFTGDSEAGKSTLVAGLASETMPLYCDDVLIIDPSDAGAILCLPGHKKLKLWEDAFALVGVRREAQVFPDTEKYFARAAHASAAGPLPLAGIFRLERGDAPSVEPLAGARRFAALANAFYRPQYAPLVREHGASLFEFQARLARSVEIYEFRRPMDRERFQEGIELVADVIARQD